MTPQITLDFLSQVELDPEFRKQTVADAETELVIIGNNGQRYARDPVD